MDVGVDEIREWHLKNGWSDIGYHFVIRRNGLLEIGRSIESIGAHVKGYNTTSVGICMIGGRSAVGTEPENNFTGNQWNTLRALLPYLEHKYPDAVIKGHNEFTNTKNCPSFDVQKWLKHGR